MQRETGDLRICGDNGVTSSFRFDSCLHIALRKEFGSPLQANKSLYLWILKEQLLTTEDIVGREVVSFDILGSGIEQALKDDLTVGERIAIVQVN